MRDTKDRIKRNDPLLLSGVLLLVFAVYLPSLSNPFFSLDDPSYVLDNTGIRSLDAGHIRAIFTTPVVRAYTPLTVLSFALEHRFFGNKPFGYHLDNLLLHLAVVAMIFILARRLQCSAAVAAGAALLFGVHPLHVEPVVWVSGRKDVLYAFLYLLSVWQYLLYRRAAGKTAYALSLIFGLLSMLAKPMALSLPIVLLLIDWLLLPRDRRPAAMVLDKLPYLLFIFPIAYKTFSLYGHFPAGNPASSGLIWVWSLVFYVGKFFWPGQLYPAYALPSPVALQNPAYLAALAGFALLTVILFRYRSRRMPVFAAGFYFFSIFFLLRYSEVTAGGNPVADRFMYLPSLGICLWLATKLEPLWLGVKGKGGRAALICAAILLVFVLSVKTRQQIALWKDEVGLWTKTIAHSPAAFLAYNARGNLYSDGKNYEMAIADFNRAIALRPEYAEGYNNRGIAYYHQARLGLALADFNEAVRLKPNTFANAYTNRGLVYDSLGRKEPALADYNRALSINPDDPYAYNNRGKLYYYSRQYELALADFRRAIEIKPDLVKAIVNRGNVYLMKGDYDAALADYNQALVMDQACGGCYYNRSLIYWQQADFPSALADALKARSRGFAVADNFIENLERMIK